MLSILTNSQSFDLGDISFSSSPPFSIPIRSEFLFQVARGSTPPHSTGPPFFPSFMEDKFFYGFPTSIISNVNRLSSQLANIVKVAPQHYHHLKFLRGISGSYAIGVISSLNRLVSPVRPWNAGASQFYAGHLPQNLIILFRSGGSVLKVYDLRLHLYREVRMLQAFSTTLTLHRVHNTPPHQLSSTAIELGANILLVHCTIR